ncbi:MAG: hypothetical protein DRR06_00565 [Gammaproteobacteria bacterium]|nr:MAG: hypothetical protein DRQ54_05715 [Gammaproteobacteria bacterium]RLA48074.1 MAG: hypothetical protein DRR06_00565 [Gammaproteobacteria bacterium]
MAQSKRLSQTACYLEIAKTVARVSQDPSTRVGAVIVARDGSVSLGYNRLPKRVKNARQHWNHPNKYKLVITAEMDAIQNAAGTDLTGATLYLSEAACTLGAKSVVDSGIGHVVHPIARLSTDKQGDHNYACKLLSEAKIKVTKK